MSSKPPCPDCGPKALSHVTEYLNALMDILLQPLSGPAGIVVRKILAPIFAPVFFGHLTPFILKKLIAYKLATLVLGPAKASELMIRCMWEEAEKRGIAMQELCILSRRRGVCLAEFKGKTHCFDRLPRPPGVFSKSIDWLDNKAILKKRLQAAGFPVARGGVCARLATARGLFRRLNPPLVVKPHLGSASRHTTIHLETEAELVTAFKKARQLSPLVVIEDELKGSVFRATLINKKLIGVIRRDPPRVIGNGRDSIRELLKKENEHPLRKGPIFSQIPANAEVESELVRQHLTWESVPAKGQVVTLNQKINWSGGGTTEDVTEKVHQENIKLFKNMAIFLDDPLIGIDFIIENIARSWREQKHSGVIECNSLPFIDSHHYPFTGQPRNAAGALWDMIFPSSNA